MQAPTPDPNSQISHSGLALMPSPRPLLMYDPPGMRRYVVSIALSAAMVAASALDTAVSARVEATQAGASPGPQDDRFDTILDLYVRDGLVYYRALQLERANIDRYVASLDVAPAVYDAWPRARQMAFWLNAYNAFILRTVIDHYPIRGRAGAYPANSIRQVPGAFDGARHRAAGRLVSLDEIEKTILPDFGEPRAQLALGRGAVGSGRLRSEAFRPDRLEFQLTDGVAEFTATPRHINVDRAGRHLQVSAIIGWHDAAFAAAYADQADTSAARSPLERAVVALIEPHLLPLERSFLRADDFVVEYLEFDWSLNDLTGV